MTSNAASIDIRGVARAARDAARVCASLPTITKNAVLHELAGLIEQQGQHLLEANRADCQEAERARLPRPKIQRLALTSASLAQLAAGIRQVRDLPDPVGVVTRDNQVPSGLRVTKVRSPLGVIAMIYESRPGVTVDAFSLCFKAGNACILKGGKEAERSNAALAALGHQALESQRVPAAALVNLSGTPREATESLLTCTGDIDLVIPRGGPELIRFVHERSRIPTIQHFHGVCHAFIDQHADLDMAERICLTAKTSAPATCNALECILVHEAVAAQIVPRLLRGFAALGVEVRGDPEVERWANSAPVTAAMPSDFGAEFLDLIVAMRVVKSLDEAIDHIARYGSDHTDAIITRDVSPGGTADEFKTRVQSSCVVVNASTRFNDGLQLGLGAEIGISTSRIHAYGPMGLEELTTQRWVVEGSGQTR
jgi:glutamate-5-semialdehyde dehydrogenase